jgi:hypothetical protein
MPIHAGFAYAAQIRKRVLNDSILLAYHAERINRTLFVPSMPGGPPEVALNLYLDPPQIDFDPAMPGGFLLIINGTGQLTVDFAGPLPESRLVKVQIIALVRPRFAVSSAALTLSPLTEDVALAAWAFSIAQGGPFSSNVNTYLTGPVFKDRLEATVALGLTSGFLNIPPIRIGALGSAFNVSNTTSISRVLDESVLIGLNLETDSLRIVGQIQELTSFAGSHDIALVINPASLPIMFADSLTKLNDAVAAEDATLDSLSIVPVNDKITVAGEAHNDFGSVEFSFDAVLALMASRGGKYFQYLDRPVWVNTRIWPAVNFRVQNVKVDVDPATWVRVVQVLGAFLTGAVVPLIVEDLIRGVTHQVTFAIKTAPVGSSISRVQYLEPLRQGDPRVRLRINDFRIDTDGIFSGIGVTPQLPSPLLMGLLSIPANYLSRIIRYRLIPPIGVFDDDPFLRAHWQVQDLSSGQLLLDEDGPAVGRLQRDLRVADFGGAELALGISCGLYRRVGSEVTPVFTDGVRLEITEPLVAGDLIRWRYQVKNPQVGYSDKDQEWKYLGDSQVKRWSAVHRLDKPCKMATEQSRYAQGENVVKLDDFPYPLTEVANRREGLCSFCFFGGPGDGKRPFL